MSEETPLFKVTDRRLFNPDGTAREDAMRERDAKTAAEASTAKTSEAENRQSVIDVSSTATPPTPPTAAQSQTRRASSTSSSPTSSSPAAEASTAQNTTDPLFLEAAMLIAQQAAAMMSGHPQFGGEVNLPESKIFLDMLASIRAKADGNLSAEEQQTLDSLLSQLRMQFVQLQQQQSAPKTGFSGSDITGGR